VTGRDRPVTKRRENIRNRYVRGSAALRSLAIGALKLGCAANIAAAARDHARDATRPLATLGLTTA